MPVPEWLLSYFITTKGMGSVGDGAMKPGFLASNYGTSLTMLPGTVLLT